MFVKKCRRRRDRLPAMLLFVCTWSAGIMSSAATDGTSSSDDGLNDAVLALVGRWQVHAIADRAATRQQCEELGVHSDVFDLFAVPGATLKSCVVGVDVVAAGSVEGAPMVAMYIVANDRSGKIGMRTRGEWRDMPSYRLLTRSASSPDAVSWECLREGDTHVIEWRRIGAVPDTASAPKVSPSALIRCGVLPAPRSSVRCGCGVFGCAAASAELPDDVFLNIVAGLGSDREAHERCQTAKARRDKLNACVALARAHAARRLQQEAGASSSSAATTAMQVSARAHLHPAAFAVVTSLNPKARRYNSLGPWDEQWMSANVPTTAERRFFDRVDFSLAEVKDADAVYIPNFTFRVDVPTPVGKKRAAARVYDQLDGVNDAVARNLSDMSPEELERLHASPRIKIINIDDEQKLLQYDRLQRALDVMTTHCRAYQERNELQQAEVERLDKELRSCKVFAQRGWFSEAELHRPDRCATQSYFFGIPGTWAGLVALVTALFPKLNERHSRDERGSSMTSFEQCLLTKAYLHLGWPVHVIAHQVRQFVATTQSAGGVSCVCRDVVPSASCMKYNLCACVAWQANCSRYSAVKAIRYWKPKWVNATSRLVRTGMWLDESVHAGLQPKEQPADDTDAFIDVPYITLDGKVFGAAASRRSSAENGSMHSNKTGTSGFQTMMWGAACGLPLIVRGPLCCVVLSLCCRVVMTVYTRSSPGSPTHVYACVCMYVCMDVCMYVCMYVCV